MRKVTGMLIVIALFVGFFAAETSAAAADLEHLKERLDAQARRIKTLEAHVSILRKKVKKLKETETTAARKTNDSTKSANTSGEDDKTPAKLRTLSTKREQWKDRHYVDYSWVDRRGWKVHQGYEQKAWKLVAERGRQSRLRHKTLIEGDLAVSAYVLARGEAHLELVHKTEKQPYKTGFAVPLPEKKPARVSVARTGDTIRATVNGEDVTVVEKNYGGKAEEPVYVAITIQKGGEVLVRSINIRAAQ